SALESAALKNEANGKPDERSEDRPPDEEPDVRGERAERSEIDARPAPERDRERDEAEETDVRAASPEAALCLGVIALSLLRVAERAFLLRHQRAAPTGSTFVAGTGPASVATPDASTSLAKRTSGSIVTRPSSARTAPQS